jgi:asparagine synthase (glutamine-hydrolysing)
MCGISGIFEFGGEVDRAELGRLTDALAHRGPDGRGLLFDGGLGLGHRRLAILDLSRKGRNPLPYEDSQPVARGAGLRAAWREFRTDEQEAQNTPYRYWITFNGEIYNFVELRKELAGMGYRFRTQTDTEVILAAYAQWGEGCLRRFNGMWAFAIWDRVERRLFLARDRFGIKPLYYRHDKKRLVFASELKAFLALTGFKPALHEALVPAMLDHPAALEGTTDETLLAGVRRLPPGHVAVIEANGDLWVRRWWETRDHLPAVPAAYEDQVEQFRGLFLDAVRLRLRSDVPVATCLSGGVDSSAIACAMAQVHATAGADLTRTPSDWRRAFIADFPGTMLDERRYADAIVRHTGARPHIWTFDQDDAARHVIDSVWSMEEVYGGLAVPVWCLYRELRRAKVKVSLDGHGGDELLGGYAWYLDWPLAQANDNLYRDFHATLLPAILRNFDRCSMAHGIEVRMPLMDWRLVTFAHALPVGSKFGGGYTKRVLRDAIAGLVPDEVRLRRFKMGFNSPLIEWFNGRLAPLVRQTVNHPLWLDSRFWDGPGLRDRALAKTDARAWTPGDWAEAIHLWTRMNLVLWQRLFVERADPATLQP